jgi:hypothetical protein
VVGEWVARHGMTSAEYQAEFDQQNRAGFYPICVQDGGSGDATRYTAIFAKQDIPLSREWTVTGAPVPALAGFDHIMQSFMHANGVRAAQLAIAKDGVGKFSRAYGWAEAGYRLTQPSDRFLLASCSKMFLEAAVQSLYDAKHLNQDAKVYPLLGFSSPLDPRSDSITIQELLDHRGGYNDDTPANGGSGFDPTYRMREIAFALGMTQPVCRGSDGARASASLPSKTLPRSCNGRPSGSDPVRRASIDERFFLRSALWHPALSHLDLGLFASFTLLGADAGAGIFSYIARASIATSRSCASCTTAWIWSAICGDKPGCGAQGLALARQRA